MKKSLLLVSVVLAGLVTQQSCSEPAVDLAATSANCPDAGALAKKVQSVTGLVGYLKPRDLYVISVATSNLDAQDIGFLCNLPEAYKKEGLAVTFSGSYHQLKEPIGWTAGSTEYALTLTKIEAAQK